MATSDTLTCPNKHRFKKSDILKPNFEFKRVCKNCTDLLLRIDFIDFCINCKKKVPSERLCKDFRNCCIECLLKTASPHINLCSVCRSKLPIGYSSCEKCKKWHPPNAIHGIPVCADHKYCKLCLNTQSKIMKCKKCLNYFKNIGVQPVKNVMTCNICSMFPNSTNIRCGKHLYCAACEEFILKNDYQCFPNVTNCKNCVDVIKNLRRTPLKNFEEEEKAPKVVEELKMESNHPLHSLNVRNLLRFPKEKAISSPQSEFSIVPTSNPSDIASKIQIAGSRSQSFTPSNSGIKIQASLTLKNQPRTDPIFNNERSVDITVKCHICKVIDITAIGFLCNHNYCTECLVLNCVSQIWKFLYYFNHENEYSRNSQFQYSCCIPNCQIPLQVPTQLITIHLESYAMGQIPIKSAGNFEQFVFYYQQLLPIQIHIWIPYFDGIKYRIFARLFN